MFIKVADQVKGLRVNAHSGIRRDITFVADDGANPSPSPTRTLEPQSSSKEWCAAGGAANVPIDQKATPAKSTTAPPILHDRGFREET